MGNDRVGVRAAPRWFGVGASLVLAGVSVAGAAPASGLSFVGLPAAGAGHAGGPWLDTTPSTISTTLSNVRSVINAASGTAGNLTGAGVGIALLDTGVAPVPGLPPAQLVNGPDLSFESQSSNLRYLDTYGHGTHMAGIIVGNDTATGTVGLAPRSKVTSVKVGDASGTVDVSQMIAAIDWVVAHKNDDSGYPIRVLNLSYGSGGTPAYASDPLSFAVEQAWKAGIVVVAAAGNDGNSSALLNDPAADPFVVSVGSSSTYGSTATSDDQLSSFTNLATSSRTVDLLAPGDGIVSLRDEGSNIDVTYPTARVGTTLFRGSGTSQAAAVVSAAAALLLQNRPGLSADQVKTLLKNSGTPITIGTGATKNLKEVNVGAAVAMASSTATQTWAASGGTGSIDGARGANHVVRDNVSLSGDNSIFGPFSSSTWAGRARTATSWSGGLWMGYRMAGDAWTGTGGSVATGQISGLGGNCVDVEQANPTSGTPVQLYACNNTNAQYWSLQPDGTIQAMGNCMDVQNAQTGNGTLVQSYTCNGTAAQVWKVTADRELVNPASGRCLDATSAIRTITLSVRLQIWDCNKSVAQRWMPPFASKTWGAATWTAAPWSGANFSWVDPSWAGTYWTGHYWSGHYWSGHYWSGSGWSTANWG